jgi:sodium-dependent phosphate cotransporter
MVRIGAGGELPNPIKASTKVALEPLERAVAAVFGDGQAAAVALIVCSMCLIFLALTYLVRTLRGLAASRMQVYLTRSLEASPYIGILIGIVVTVMVQSSSITTSVMVPLAGAGLVTLEQVFPITLGANVGTTITALLASMAAPAETAALAVQIALVHLLFNLMGIVLVFPLRVTRQIPLRAATWLAAVAARSKRAAILYLLLLFYGVPAVLVMLSRFS